MNAILYSKKFNRYNIKKDSPRKKTLYKNRSIDRIFDNKMNINSSEYRASLKIEKDKISKLNSLISNNNSNFIQTQRNKIRENLKKPKLPFSQRLTIPKDIRLKKIESLKPSLLYHDNHVINWIRNKYSQSVIEKSLYSILPKQAKMERNRNETELEKRKRKMVEFLEGSKEPTGREKYVKIHPKYFYDESTFEKIKQLKDIFLEFDKNGNNKMGIDELVTMFNENNIKANEEDLVKLFFKNKKIKKKEYFKLYLTFYQFLNFALHNDEEFRKFMRKLKIKCKEEIKKNNNLEYESLYFPMNLNLLFDYFISRTKEISSMKKIKGAIDSINKVVTNIEKINFNEDSFKNLDIEKIEKTKKLNNHNLNLDLNEDLDLLENIDFSALFDEFKNLFTVNKLEDFEKEMKSNKRKKIKNELKTITKDFIINKKKKKFSSDFMDIKNIKNNLLFNYEANKDNKDNIPLIYELSKNKDDQFLNDIKRCMNRSSIIQMNMDNFKKYHNLQIALEATKESINKMKTNDVSNSNDNNKKNINKSTIPLIEKKYTLDLNDKLKNCFFFKYKNISKSNSTKLFNKNELINFKKNSFFSKLYNNSIDNYLNKFSININMSSNLIDINKTGYYSTRKLDYVPMDLIKVK